MSQAGDGSRAQTQALWHLGLASLRPPDPLSLAPPQGHSRRPVLTWPGSSQPPPPFLSEVLGTRLRLRKPESPGVWRGPAPLWLGHGRLPQSRHL